MRYLGIDYGTKRVGLALSDESGTLAFAHSIVSPSEAPALIAALVETEEVGTIIIGKSLDLLGTPNKVQVKIAKCKEELEKLVLVPVIYAPEFMTSAQASRNPAGESARIASPQKNKNMGPVDASAAALILQGYIDRVKNTNG